MRRKHRVVVEITLERPCTAKVATQVVQDMLNVAFRRELFLEAVTRFEAKQFGRVAQGLTQFDKLRRGT